MNQQEEEINQEVEIDFGKYVRIIWNGKIFIIILTTIITLLSAGYSLIIPETFKWRYQVAERARRIKLPKKPRRQRA